MEIQKQKMSPIFFSSEMVQAILEGRKTMTRRIVKMPPRRFDHHLISNKFFGESGREYKCPYGKVGDVLWVRETWNELMGDYYYKATDSEYCEIFMPKAACRIFLEITNVRVERLQDISEKDARKEGVESCYPSQLCGLAYKDYLDYPDDEFEWFSKAKFSFQSLWQKINGPKSWDANPWVWVIEFKQIEKQENFK